MFFNQYQGLSYCNKDINSLPHFLWGKLVQMTGTWTERLSVCSLLSGCDMWSSYFSRHHSRVAPFLGNIRPSATPQPHLPCGGADTATFPVLQIPRTGSLQHHSRRHHHYFRVRGWKFRRILGEREIGADLWASRAFSGHSFASDSYSVGPRCRTFPGWGWDAGADPAGVPLGEPAGALSRVRSIFEWYWCSQKEGDRGAV